MTSTDFLDFTEYRQFFNQQSKTSLGIPFRLTSCVKFELDVDNMFILKAFESYSGLPNDVSLKKRGRTMSGIDFIENPKKKYEDKLRIDDDKLQHVLSGLQYNILRDIIPPIHHPYYYALNSNETTN